MARASDLNAPRVAGGTGSEDGSNGRSGESVTIEGDPTERESLKDSRRSGDPDGKSWVGDEGLVGCRSGDLVAITGDPAECRRLGDACRSGTMGAYRPRSGDPGDGSRSGDRNTVEPSDEIGEVGRCVGETMIWT